MVHLHEWTSRCTSAGRSACGPRRSLYSAVRNGDDTPEIDAWSVTLRDGQQVAHRIGDQDASACARDVAASRVVHTAANAHHR
ncbi:hypothetical protein BOX37_13730 [Nocardia mangyaensis]|uniref:Uncharacterized protein n=1 Tax=Nocardia mangyaensis TaxID=2213200 RepID=A0A1J0VSB5_9NOCA|nr:hypothetical protein BOX37_13730 [Nocardia mangyaensis]